jgi:hypothetical protein
MLNHFVGSASEASSVFWGCKKNSIPIFLFIPRGHNILSHQGYDVEPVIIIIHTSIMIDMITREICEEFSSELLYADLDVMIAMSVEELKSKIP